MANALEITAPPPSLTGRWRRVLFWIKRYGPPEVACLVTMLAASVAAAAVTDSPPLLAASAIAGATVGFYGVLIVSVSREQLGVIRPGEPRRLRRVATRTVLLLAAEFGLAEVLDTFLIRPALMMACVILIHDDVWGLLAGKFISDILFYLLSAFGYRLTELAGVRRARVGRSGR